MILNFYRTNEALKVFTLPLLAGLFWVVYFLKPTLITVEHPMPLFALVQWLGSFGFWISGAVAIVLISIKAIILNKLFNQYEFTRRATALAPLLLVLMLSIYVSSHGLHPMHFLNLFVLLILRRLLSIHRQNSVLSESFDAGLLAGVASLFYFPALLLVPFIWACLSVLRPFVWREYLLVFLGVLLPWLFALVWMLYDGDWSLFSHLIPYQGFDINAFFSQLIWIDYALIAVNGLLLIAAARHFLAAVTASTKRERNVKQLFIILSVFLLLIFGTSLFRESETYRLSLLSIPLAMLYTYYFFSAKRQVLASLLFYGWLVLAGVAQYLYWTQAQ